MRASDRLDANSSGERRRLGGITKRGDVYLRTLLVHGARAALRTVGAKEDRRSGWIRGVAATHHANVAAVALANRNARTAWALLESDAAARTAYEGNSQMDGEALDPAWARFYPDYDALAADGSLAEAAQALWAPLEQWTRDAVRVHDHGAATATATATATPAASSTEASL